MKSQSLIEMISSAEQLLGDGSKSVPCAVSNSMHGDWSRSKVGEILKKYFITGEEYAACMALNDKYNITYGCKDKYLESISFGFGHFDSIPAEVKQLKNLWSILFHHSIIKKIEPLDELQNLRSLGFQTCAFDPETPENKAVISRLTQKGVNVWNYATVGGPDVDATGNKGVILFNQRKFEESERYFRDEIKIHPNSPANYIGLGNALYKQGKHDEAVKNYILCMDLHKAQENKRIAKKNGAGR